MSDRAHSKGSAEIEAHLRHTIETGEVSSFCIKIDGADGSARSIAGSAEAEYDANGRIKALVGTLRDVTGHPQQTGNDYDIVAAEQLAAGIAHNFHHLLYLLGHALDTAGNPAKDEDAAACLLQEAYATADRGIQQTNQLLARMRTRSQQPEDPPPLPPPAYGRNEKILVVDDDPAMRRCVVQQLEQLNYRVVEAPHAEAALQILERSAIDVLFSDVMMPGDIDGFTLVTKVRTRWPGVKLLLTSAWSPEALAEPLQALTPPIPLLAKPYQHGHLADVMRKVLDG